jgi:hypothetical protein
MAQHLVCTVHDNHCKPDTLLCLGSRNLCFMELRAAHSHTVKPLVDTRLAAPFVLDGVCMPGHRHVGATRDPLQLRPAPVMWIRTADASIQVRDVLQRLALSVANVDERAAQARKAAPLLTHVHQQRRTHIAAGARGQRLRMRASHSVQRRLRQLPGAALWQQLCQC